MIGTLNVELDDQPEELRLEIKQRSDETIDISLPDYSVTRVDSAGEPVAAVHAMLHDAWARGAFLGRRLAFDHGRMASAVGKLMGLARGEYEQARRMARCAPAMVGWPSPAKLAAAAGVAVNLCRICHGAGSVGVAPSNGKPDEFAPLRRCVSCRGTGEAGGVVSGAEVTCKHCGHYLREHDAQERCVPFNAETFAVDMEQVLEATTEDPRTRPAPAPPVEQRAAQTLVDAMMRDDLSAEHFPLSVNGVPQGTLGEFRARGWALLDPEKVAAQRMPEFWPTGVGKAPADFESEPTAAAPLTGVTIKSCTIERADPDRAAVSFARQVQGRPQEQADALEEAYWRFDSLCHGRQEMTDRDAFKAVARDLIHRTMRQDICWTEPGVPTAPTPPDPIREGYELRQVPERWPGQAIVMPPGSVDRELHDLADVLDRTHRGGLSLSMSTRGGATLQLAYMTPEQAKADHERAMAAIQPDPGCANCGEAEDEHGPLGACLVSCGETFEPNTIERKVDAVERRSAAADIAHERIDTVEAQIDDANGIEVRLAKLETELESYTRLHGKHHEVLEAHQAIPDTVATRLLKIQAAAIDDLRTKTEDHDVTWSGVDSDIAELQRRVGELSVQLGQVLPPKQIRIALVGQTGRKPERMSATAAGLDCYAANTCARQVAVGQRWRVPLGFKIEIPPGWFGAVVGRSGGFERDGLLVHFGVVDSDYRGEVHALFQNNGREGYTIQPGHRIAQLVILPVAMLDLVVVGALSDTARGERGFGHTGDR